MSETKESVKDVESTTSEETTIKEVKKDIKLSPEEQKLQDLHTARMGQFKVTMAYADAVYFRNMLDKSEYKGPQQAYLLVISKAEMSNISNTLKDQDQSKRYDVDVSSACIESLNFFMNNKVGKGEHSAQRLFSASMILRQSISEINNIDTELKNLKEASLKSK